MRETSVLARNIFSRQKANSLKSDLYFPESVFASATFSGFTPVRGITWRGESGFRQAVLGKIGLSDSETLFKQLSKSEYIFKDS